jgi:hypothetical protein
MSIAGNLRTMQLADLLQWLERAGSTGTLVISGREVEKSLYFFEGRLISCNSSDPKEFLGHFLVSRGAISESQLERAVSQQDRSSELLGAILVTQGSVTEETLERMLRVKAEESIYDLFRWREGEFRFIEDELPRHELVPVSVDVTGVVFEGTRRVDEWRRIEEVIPSMQCVPVAVGDLLAGESDDPRRAVLQAVDDDRTIEEICLQTHSSEFFVCEILFDVTRRGLLKLVRPRFAHPEGDESTTTAEALMAQAHAHIKEKRFGQALRRLRAARSLEPDNRQLLDAVRTGENEIRAALESDGVDVAGVPRLTRPLERLGALSFSPEEGFVLSRINGSSDISAILKISPVPELDARLVFWRLLKDGHIEIEYPTQ